MLLGRYLFLFDKVVIVCKRRGYSYELKEIIELLFHKMTDDPMNNKDVKKVGPAGAGPGAGADPAEAGVVGWPDKGWLVGGPASSHSVRPSTSLVSRLSLSWGWGGGPKSRSQRPSEDAEWGPCPRPLVESSLRHRRPGSSPCARAARDTSAPPHPSHFGRKLWISLPMAVRL
mgnify:CR=1 FL=1